ncbi:MAG: peptidase M61 [Sphingomonas bacterium]|nr:peptidase M61 [Sphingomonas bacterium]
MTSPYRAYALALALPLFIAIPSPISAQNTLAPVAAHVDTFPAPRDLPYPGTIQLEVDATDIARAIFKVRETIPVAQPGRMILQVPKWLPGHHGPDGEIDKVAGVTFTANGQTLPWKRDPIEVNAYQIDVPAGVSAVEARFSFLSALNSRQGRIVVTPEMLNIQWEAVSMYPAGYYTRQIPVVASVILPAGWHAATALRPTATAPATGANRITYGVIDYENLIDSPIFAGRYFRKDDLGHNVTLNSFADDPKELKIPAEVIAKHAKMVDQAIKTFGARHFDHYDFLNAITDKLGGIGLEHHRSTEISSDPGAFIDYDNHAGDRNVFPHEFVHSWDGKFRRPAGQNVADFRTPLNNDLLWVYEGQTQFWGWVLEARGGMSPKQHMLDVLALYAAGQDQARGRDWRPLLDTTNDPIIQNRRPQPWGSYQRNENYYVEGLLIWLEADAIIRRGTANKRGMDDFARAFFGVRDGDWGNLPYTRDDVIATLNAVYPNDWASFLRDRVDAVAPRAPLAGITLSGYELRYTDEPNNAAKAFAKGGPANADFNYSLGFSVDKDAKLGSVLWGSPAFNAALRSGDEIVAVGERAWSEDAMKDAIAAAKDGKTPIRLTIKRGDAVKDYSIQYAGGLRYPQLVKIGKSDGPLDLLLKPR